MTTDWLVDGKPGRVDPRDRGLAYGDGVFETMAALSGRIRWLDYHLDRLEEGCRKLAIPLADRNTIVNEISAVCTDSDRAVVKLIVTRGVSARGYAPTEDPEPTRIIGTARWPAHPASYYTDGIALRTLKLRLGENPRLAGIKHLCRLEQVLARVELNETNEQEGLLLDTSGFVVGGIASNVFAVSGSTLLTPGVRRCGVKGVMRRVVLESCEQFGLRPEESDLAPQALRDADELFVSNAVVGIWPVRDLDGQPRRVGEATRRLQNLLGVRSRA